MAVIGKVGLENIVLDIQTKLKKKTYYANAADTNGRGLKVTVKASGVVYDCTGVTLRLSYIDSLGEAKYYDFTSISPVLGTFELAYPTDMIRDRGSETIPCTIVAFDATSQIAYETIYIYVHEPAVTDADTVASNEYSTLQAAMNTLDGIDIPALEAHSTAETGRVTAEDSRILSEIGRKASELYRQATYDGLDTRIDNIIATPTTVSVEEVIDARGGQASLGAKMRSTDAQLADKANQPSQESIYALAKVKDLSIVGYGDSITVGQTIPNAGQRGCNNFVNTFYMDLMRKTANFLYAQIANFTFLGDGNFGNNTDPSVLYIVPSQKGLNYIFPYNSTNGSIKFNYWCKELVVWGIKTLLEIAKCSCDVFIDGVLVGTIDQKGTVTDDFYPYVFQATTEGLHAIEFKNFRNTGSAISGKLYFPLYGISNRKHNVYNGALGGQGTTWGLANLQTKVIAKAPDIVFLGFGNNDGYNAPGISTGITVEQYEINLNSIISQIQLALPNCIVSLMNIIPCIDDARFEIVKNTFLPVVYRVSKNKNCRIIDTWNLFKDLDIALWRSDNVHPNEYGHTLIKKEVELKWCPEILAINPSQSDSIATDTLTLKKDFNSLLLKLRSLGLI